ncbi:MAG TPA: phage tail protein [Vicinamibacterales bacterium]|nr:phage tail protein [Vicinamibacterales bacterium]
MPGDAREPFLNTRFRVEIDGLPRAAVIEVVFPEARIVSGRGKAGRIQHGALTLRRAMTASSDWYRWWDSARRSARTAQKQVIVVLIDRSEAEVCRWTFAGARPAAYATSVLNALRSDLLIETLELTVSGFRMNFAGSEEA